MSGHALLAPSSAERWIKCPPSVLLTKDVPETESIYAKEGTLAHEIVALMVQRNVMESLAKATYTKKLNKLKKDELYKPEMLSHGETYLDYILNIVHRFSSRPYVSVERKYALSSYASDCWGTADATIIHGEELHIIDYKYGKGVKVDAAENQQLMCYGLGALSEFKLLFPITTVHLHIVQPRMDNISSWAIARTDLEAWGQEVLKPAAEKAVIGAGAMCSGEHCRFCKIKSICRSRAEENFSIEPHTKNNPSTLTLNEIGALIQKAKDFKKWADDLESYAYSQLQSGAEIPGWKLVQGNKRRYFTDIDKAFEKIVAEGTEEALLYSRQPLSLTEVEKMIGKKKFEEIAGEYIGVKRNNPSMAPESDKREAITVKPTALDDFGTPA